MPNLRNTYMPIVRVLISEPTAHNTLLLTSVSDLEALAVLGSCGWQILMFFTLNTYDSRCNVSRCMFVLLYSIKAHMCFRLQCERLLCVTTN